MEPSNRWEKVRGSADRPVTFIDPRPQGLEYTQANPPADENMPEAEPSTAPSEAVYHGALYFAQTYQQRVHRMLTESGVFIREAGETFDVQGHRVHSVEPIEVMIPELDGLRASRREKQAVINRLKEALQAAKDYHRLSSEARAQDIASLINQLGTAEGKLEDLRESLSQEQDLVAAQAAEIGKLTATNAEAEGEQQRLQEWADFSAVSAWYWYEKWLAADAESKGKSMVMDEFRRERTEAQQAAAAAQTAERAAVQAFGREHILHTRESIFAKKQLLEVDRLRKDAAAQKEAAAQDKAVVEEKLAEALRQLEEARLELSNARGEVQES